MLPPRTTGPKKKVVVRCCCCHSDKKKQPKKAENMSTLHTNRGQVRTVELPEGVEKRNCGPKSWKERNRWGQTARHAGTEGKHAPLGRRG